MKSDKIRVVRKKEGDLHLIFYRDESLVEETDSLKRHTGNLVALGLAYLAKGDGFEWIPGMQTFRKSAYEPTEVEVERPEWILAGVTLAERFARFTVQKNVVRVTKGRLEEHAVAVWAAWPQWHSKAFAKKCEENSRLFSPLTLAVESLQKKWPNATPQALRDQLRRLNLSEPWTVKK